MPGYIMHMAEANLILDKIGSNRSEQWKRAFIAGNLLPDTKKKDKKVTSHFWHPDTLDDMAIPPDLGIFLDKYKKYLNDPLVLGYYAHLYLDEKFVKVYWKDMATFLDDDGNIKTKKQDITKVRIGKTGEVISRDTFFSDAYYYGDYSKLNDYFIEKYKIDLKKDYTAIDVCLIEEVIKEEIHQVVYELKMITRENTKRPMGEIQVFTKGGLSEFLENTAASFIKEVKL